MLTFPDIARPEALRNALWGRAPDAAAAPAVSAATSRSAKERLAELENLRQQGLVSQEEYAAKKAEILSHL